MKNKDILDILAEKEILGAKDVISIREEAESQKILIEDLLERKKIIDIEGLTKIKAETYGFPYKNLLDKDLSDDALQTIPSEVAQNYKIICFAKEDKKIKVGIIDTNNFKAIEAVDFLAKRGGLLAEYFLISKKSFNSAFKKYKILSKELTSALESKEESEEKEKKKEEDDSGGMEEITKSAPVAKIVSVIIRHAVEGKASDIHIEPLDKETRIRYRIDGILHTSLVLPRNIHTAIVARVKVMANLKLDETRIPQDGRIRMAIDDKEYDFRVSILPLTGSEKVVMRILDTNKGAPSLVDLGFQGHALRVIEEGIKKTEGLFLVTGPTGSGKSTTLFSVLSSLNKEGINISTLEDPVEYHLPGANQSQVRPEIGYTFSSGLRSFLRQDPDIIMVGEIRDTETAELSIHAAMTGHFVLSTVHTISAVGAITRLVDIGVEPFLVGTTLRIIVSQRLARKICENCREEIKMTKEVSESLRKELKKIPSDYVKEIIPEYDVDNLKMFKGMGCVKCGNTGYKGRVAISEVIDVNKKMQEQILDGKKYFSTEEIRENQKYITITEDGLIKIIQGKTTMEDVLRVTQD
ncbi:MAG: GspE/PulE family protein [Patescibacteria group bacterium]|jgi:type IV pilus assembly protein PilB|nr:GspE/PulE family protein [Patescibacteria group bacterium]